MLVDVNPAPISALLSAFGLRLLLDLVPCNAQPCRLTSPDEVDHPNTNSAAAIIPCSSFLMRCCHQGSACEPARALASLGSFELRCSSQISNWNLVAVHNPRIVSQLSPFLPPPISADTSYHSLRSSLPFILAPTRFHRPNIDALCTSKPDNPEHAPPLHNPPHLQRQRSSTFSPPCMSSTGYCNISKVAQTQVL